MSAMRYGYAFMNACCIFLCGVHQADECTWTLFLFSVTFSQLLLETKKIAANNRQSTARKLHIINRQWAASVNRETRSDPSWAAFFYFPFLFSHFGLVSMLVSRLASTRPDARHQLATSAPNERRNNWKWLIYARSTCLSRSRVIFAIILTNRICVSCTMWIRYLSFLDWNSIRIYANIQCH